MRHQTTPQSRKPITTSNSCLSIAYRWPALPTKIDARKLHQLIHGFLQDETAERWINPKERNQDGQLAYLDLLDHYEGEGNKAARIKEAEELQTSLIYNNEIAMSFEKFLKNIQEMFTGFFENGEILNDSKKIGLLFQKVQKPIMTQIKASLHVSYDMYRDNIVTYDFIFNSLAAESASLGYHTPCRAADVNTCGKKAPENGAKGAGGEIFTGFYSNWSKLSEREKKSIFDER